MKIGRLTIEFKVSWERSYMKQVKIYLRQGSKLMAVKTYKDATGKSLKESKEAVDVLCPEYLKRDIDAANAVREFGEAIMTIKK